MRLMTGIGEFASIKTAHRTTTNDSNFHDEGAGVRSQKSVEQRHTGCDLWALTTDYCCKKKAL